MWRLGFACRRPHSSNRLCTLPPGCSLRLWAAGSIAPDDTRVRVLPFEYKDDSGVRGSTFEYSNGCIVSDCTFEYKDDRGVCVCVCVCVCVSVCVVRGHKHHII